MNLLHLLGAIVAAWLLAYLFVALFRPERFE